ncbi:MAG: di-trans,poly-cis-decaprenylcistransferase [Planctomycetes bacterium]|nr:di-trans,poly-cis-decaprenylcistransferase [Planctomycetota bacterium]
MGSREVDGGLHVALIMDGNGRWAEARGLPRSEGHRRGADVVDSIVEAAPDAGVRILTLYAFSSDNWNRPRREVSLLMSLFRTYLRKERRRCAREGVRVTIVGRRDRLSAAVLREVDRTESATRDGDVLHLRLCVDYSSRDRLLDAAERYAASEARGRDAYARCLGEAGGEDTGAPAVDLLVRTGGEHRLSDFMLWESAYAEIRFLDVMWPEFDVAELQSSVAWFHGRERRFGRTPTR